MEPGIPSSPQVAFAHVRARRSVEWNCDLRSYCAAGEVAVASESLKPGNLVPSVREMARDLTVNPNTVALAISPVAGRQRPATAPRHRVGSHVRSFKKGRADRAALIRARLRSVLEEARQSGLTIEDVRGLADEELARLDSEEGKVMTTAFSLSHVSKQFKGELCSDDVSLSSESGCVVALLGENGAGKTTAIRILLGLLEPDAGTVSFGTRQPQAGNRYSAAASATSPTSRHCTTG